MNSYAVILRRCLGTDEVAQKTGNTWLRNDSMSVATVSKGIHQSPVDNLLFYFFITVALIFFPSTNSERPISTLNDVLRKRSIALVAVTDSLFTLTYRSSCYHQENASSLSSSI